MTEQVMATDEFVEDILAHYGVKGMRWGHRKKVSSDDVRAARGRIQRTQAMNFTKLAKLEDKAANAPTAAARAAAEKKLKKEEEAVTTAWLKNPDRATAARLTKGEKAAMAVIAVAFPGVGTAAVAGRVAGQVGARKVIERQIRKANSN